MEEDKKRIKFWGLIFVIFVLLSFAGYKLYNDGHGKSGAIRKKLMPIAEKFNESLAGFEATPSGDGIHIKDTINKTEYDYIYSNENGIEILTNEYSSSQETIGRAIAKGILDAVFTQNGGQGSAFSQLKFDDLVKSNIGYGVTLTKGSTIKIQIDINKNFLNFLMENGINNSNTNTDPNNIIGTWYWYQEGTRQDNTY